MIELKTKKTIAVLVIASLSLLLLQACSQESASPTSPATDTNTPATDAVESTGQEADVSTSDTADAASQDQGYPPLLEEHELGEGYPAPGDSDFVDSMIRPEVYEVIPTPDPAMGVVYGTVLDDRTGEAPPESAVYLGRIVTTDTGLRVVRLDRQTDPFAIPDANGRFVFPAVEANEYGLILVHPDISFVVDNPDTGHSLIFTVEPGQSVELNTIVITLP